MSDELLKCFEKSYRAAKPARIEGGLDFAIHAGLEHGGYVLRGRKAEDGRIDDRYNAKKLGKPVLHIYDDRDERISNPDSLCLEVQVLGDFVCSNKIEILNVAGPRESKEPGVYDWTLAMLRFLNRAVSGTGSTQTAGE